MSNYILSIETATESCSVAVHFGADLIAFAEVNVPKSHSNLLVSLIDQIISNAGIEKSNLSAVAVSQGPGSYTGLRIGASTAKGLCFAMDIPLIAVDTLEAMAFAVSKYCDNDTLLAPMIDARRMEIYSAVYDIDLNQVYPTSPIVLNSQSYIEFLGNGKLMVFGNGASKASSIISHRNLILIQGISPSAKYIGEMAYVKFESKHFENTAYFEPFYLKEFYTTQR